MISARLITALVAFAVASPVAAHAASPAEIERAVQYALEKLPSGTLTNTVDAGTKIAVTPVRTWKSVSGHYCRQYELTVTRPGGAPERSESTRCRDNDGVWKKIRSE